MLQKLTSRNRRGKIGSFLQKCAYRARKKPSSKSQNSNLKIPNRFNKEQYDMILRCSGKKNMKEWNEWRENNKYEDVLLEGADFTGAYLKSANLGVLQMINSETNKKVFGEVYLEGAIFEGANLDFANLQHAHLEHTKLQWTSLRNAALMDAHLEGSKAWFAHLENADIAHAYLKGAEFQRAIVNGSTSLWECIVDANTDFNGVGLDNARINPETKLLLRYNMRRLNWKKWCKNHCLWRWPINIFWLISDYGRSAPRVMGVFFSLALIFALIYWLFPSLVMVNNVVGDLRSFMHALYFSVVTMTTLGFGDIAANPDSWQGQILLMLQVLLGYVLLGAIISRFAILFTAEGPEIDFTDQKN